MPDPAHLWGTSSQRCQTDSVKSWRVPLMAMGSPSRASAFRRSMYDSREIRERAIMDAASASAAFIAACVMTVVAVPFAHVSEAPSWEMTASYPVAILSYWSNWSAYRNSTRIRRLETHTATASSQLPCHTVSCSPTIERRIVSADTSRLTRLSLPSGRHLCFRYAASSAETKMPSSPRCERRTWSGPGLGPGLGSWLRGRGRLRLSA